MDYLFVYSVPEMTEITTDFKVDAFLVEFRSLREGGAATFWRKEKQKTPRQISMNLHKYL